jgi:hypothetical protein
MSEAWDNVPEYPELADQGNSEIVGPGIGEDLTIMKPADLVGQRIAVVGFEIRPSTFDEGNLYAQVEFMDEHGEHFLFRSGGPAIMDHLKARWDAGQLPFKCTLTSQENKAGTRTYYVFR